MVKAIDYICAVVAFFLLRHCDNLIDPLLQVRISLACDPSVDHQTHAARLVSCRGAFFFIDRWTAILRPSNFFTWDLELGICFIPAFLHSTHGDHLPAKSGNSRHSLH